jgi:gamma-glutamyltranspeptidase/glutathione hydrolase
LYILILFLPKKQLFYKRMRSLKYPAAFTAYVFIAASCYGQSIGKKTAIDPYHYTVQKDAAGRQGIVVCAHSLAARVGLDMLKQGGNAVDAAIATQLALAVVYPLAGNLGGGGFMVATINHKKIALDFREVAPSAASRDMYVDEHTGKADMHLSQEGYLSCGVPGTVAGLFAAMKYAKLPFATLIQPAITLADKGFMISEGEANTLNENAAAFIHNNTMLPVFVHLNGTWKAGDTLVQKDLAHTLLRLQRYGMKDFYEGETAALIVEESKKNHGILTLDDLKDYKARLRTPEEFEYRGYRIVTMPLPGSGGILLRQMLGMLEKWPLKEYGFHTAKSMHLVTEVERRAYADRAEYLGDPDFIKVPVKTLVSQPYLQQRMADYDSLHAGISADIKPGIIKESDETTHLSIIDKDGNCVAVTTTLNGAYGSKCVVAGAGFFLNNEMDDFSVQAGVPNQYGAVGGSANAIAPHKRMLSSMSPTIVLKDGKPFLVVGTPGGTTIITSVLQSILNTIDYGMNAHDAVNEPKFHHQWLPDELDVEKGFPADVLKQLQDMGYEIKERGPLGRTEMIRLRSGNVYEGAADTRGADDAEAY